MEPLNSKQTSEISSPVRPKGDGPLFPMHPGWLIPISFAAGLAAAGPLAGAMLKQLGHRVAGWVTGIALGILGLGIILLSVFWDIEWYWNAIVLTAVNLALGVMLYFWIKALFQKFKHSHSLASEPRGTIPEIAVGIVGGGVLSGLIGFSCLNLYFLISDRLLSTFMPVTFEDYFIAVKFTGGLIPLILAGGLAGGIVGRLQPRIRTGQMLVYTIGLAFSYITWLMAMDITIAIPGFQAGSATGEAWQALMMPYYVGNFLFGCWWSVLLLFYMMKPPQMRQKTLRSLHVVGINLCAAVTIAVAFGFTADMFLSFGRHFERNADTGLALKCYQLGLKKEPEKKIASYLQYRVALMHHRLGNAPSAKKGFQRVVAKYNSNKQLVKKANRFLDNLERTATGQRIVLPGVDTRTEYKGAYCVPNSLALAMRYWGANVTAREIGENITGIGSGTFVVNQTWFAEQYGFRHEFLPMAGLDDIKACIRAGLPVLVYVPYHVFAIVGYDDMLDTFVTYDVATSDVWVEYLQKDFIKAWKKEGTTLVLVYPPEKESVIPPHIHQRLQKFSENYLHFQLYYFDAPEGSVSVPHLLKSAGETGEFFFPLTVLYANFPGIRDQVSKNYDADKVIQSIRNYFKDDFDEGTHGPGQYHNEEYAEMDWALDYSIKYLIGHRQFDLVEELVKRIDEEGQLSDEMQIYAGMINIAQGKPRQGLDRLVAPDETLNPFYAGLIYHKLGDRRAGIRELTKILNHNIDRQSYYRYYCKRRPVFHDRDSRLDLDEYGYPELATANQLLLEMDDYGESREELESGWQDFINRHPFNAPIAQKLMTFYEKRMTTLQEEGKNAEALRLSRKIRLLKNRMDAYSLSAFQQQKVIP